MKISINNQEEFDLYAVEAGKFKITAILTFLCEQYQAHEELEICIVASLLPNGYQANPAMLAVQTKSRVPFLSVRAYRQLDSIIYLASHADLPRSFFQTICVPIVAGHPSVEISLKQVPRTYKFYPNQLCKRIYQEYNIQTKATLTKTHLKINRI